VHELLQADSGGHIDTVVFNGVADTTDPGSGRRVRPCLVTLRTTRGVFEELDLAHVEPLACLKHLSAGVSKSPAELVPVRPVLEFNMVDPRFVAEGDALSELDQRPNLMGLTPPNSKPSSRTCSPRWAWKPARHARPVTEGLTASPGTRGRSSAAR
jgi:restriction system protein